MGARLSVGVTSPPGRLGSAGRLATVLGLLVGCAPLPYQPAHAEVAVIPADAFDRAVDVVAAMYPRLAVRDAMGFRIQSAWLPYQRGEATGQKRASLFLDGPGRVGVVVETRYLRLGLGGVASWSSAVAAPRLERDLVVALQAALEVN